MRSPLVFLPSGQRSGLQHALRVLQGVDGIAVCRFTRQDVMRHPLVQAIVDAYDRDWRRSKQRAEPGSPGDRGAQRPGGEEPTGVDAAPTDAPADVTPAS